MTKRQRRRRRGPAREALLREAHRYQRVLRAENSRLYWEAASLRRHADNAQAQAVEMVAREGFRAAVRHRLDRMAEQVVQETFRPFLASTSGYWAYEAAKQMGPELTRAMDNALGPAVAGFLDRCEVGAEPRRFDKDGSVEIRAYTIRPVEVRILMTRTDMELAR